MYHNFEIENRKVKLVGYEFPCENPQQVVILIHGIGEYAGRYDRLSQYFAQAGIAVFSMDLRGHGRSEGKKGHCAPRVEVLADIDALVEHAQSIYPNLPLVMYGHSMGGNIALDYRARGKYNYLFMGYVISAPWIRLGRPVSIGLVSAIKILSKILPDFQTASKCSEAELGNPEFVKPYETDPLVHPKISLLTAYEGFSIGTALEQGTNEDNGKAHNIPCLIMHGTEDRICSIEGSRNFMKLPLNATNPKMNFVELEGYRHEIHNGTPEGSTGEEVIQRAINFIEGLK